MACAKLVEYAGELISRGYIFRLPASWPYESVVDFMVVDLPDEKFGHSLVVASGNKSGLMLIQLPIESRAPGHGISTRWLIDNWSKWVYPECDVNDVFLYERSAAPSWVSTA